MHFDAFSDMHQNSAQIESICVKMHQSARKMHQNASKCIKMHQNASKCKQNELCKCFMHKIIKQVVFITYRLVKLTIFYAKIEYFVPSAQNASICIRMHQNVCRMNCANVLCMKLSKKLFLLHLNRLKLMNYLWLFVMEDPVCTNIASKKCLAACLCSCMELNYPKYMRCERGGAGADHQT